MSRNFVAFGLLALAGMLTFPEPSQAAGGGIRIGGGHVHFRAPVMLRAHPRAGILRTGRPGRIGRAALSGGTALQLPAAPKLQIGPRHTAHGGPHELQRRHHHHHRRYLTGWIYPLTIGEDWSYVGVPYGPAETIPVYAPQPADDSADAPRAVPMAPPAPRITSVPSDNQDACRAERVTVPASEGEREITVIRC